MEQELRRRRRPLECGPLRSPWAARLLAPTLSLLLLSACGSGGSSDDNPAPGPEPKPAAGLALAKTLAIAEGNASPCPYGGQLLQTGVDRNGNGVLDADEISNVQHICHGQPGTPGSPGRQALLEMKPEPAGINCAQGGTRVLSGLDLNGDRLLGSDEVLGTAYLCHGKEGAAGQQALFAVDEEPAGKNCAAGGNRLSSGLDRNGNGLLDPAEISSTRYLCRGTPAALLLNISDEPAGSYCSHGGKRLDSGLDLNGNQLLDASEISSSQRLCHGASGANGSAGLNSLLTMSPEPAGVNCPQGGRKLSSGLDANGNQLLDPNEVNASSYLCHGSSGLNSLTSISNEPAGANCAHGGRKIDSGLDSNRNGALDPGEAGPSQYVCNGAPGNTGAAGRNSLLEVLSEPAGAHCANGGKRLNTGLDSNGNGVLEAGEVTASSYVCNGANGSNGSNGSNGGAGQNSLLAVVDEPVGSNCPAGGKKISSGLDANGNGSLDVAESSATAYICHGTSSGDLSYIGSSGNSISMSANRGYVLSSASEVQLTLPAAPAVGERVAVTGAGSGGWRIVQNAGQYIDATKVGARGQNWNHRIRGPENMAWITGSSDGRRLAVVKNSGAQASISLSDDGGMSWYDRPGSAPWQVISSSDGTRLFGRTPSGFLSTSTDRGQTWVPRDSRRQWGIISSSANGQTLLATGDQLALYVSVDGGASFSAREREQAWAGVAMSASGEIMAAAYRGRYIYMSFDRGVSWAARSPARNWADVAMSADGRVIAATVDTPNKVVAISTDGGQNWVDHPISDASYVYVSADGSTIALYPTLRLSYDAGASWVTPDVPRCYSIHMSSDAKRANLVGCQGSGDGLVISMVEGRSSPGIAGSLTGESGGSVLLQYVGNGRWLALSGSGMMTAQ